MKDSAFLRNLNKKQRKLIKAGEYMQKFRNFFETKSIENQLDLIEKEVIQEILELLPKIDKARLFRGKGGEIMRIAACRLIEGLAISELKLSESLQKKYLEIIDDCLKNPLDLIQNAAVKAMKLYSGFYHQETLIKDFDQYLQKLLKTAVEDPNVAVTRGYSRALGMLNSKIHITYFDSIWASLKKNCQIKPKEADDPDTRKFAVRSLKEMISNIGLKDIKDSVIRDIFDVCFYLMGDYTTDKRGDIGSMIRETSMTMMLDLFVLIVTFNDKCPTEERKVFPEGFPYKFVALLLQQLVEKIDRVRLVAGSLLQEFFEKCSNKLPEIPRNKELSAIFCKESVQDMLKKDELRMEEIFETQKLASSAFEGPEYEREFDGFVYYWNQPHCIFPMIVPMIRFKEYSYEIVNSPNKILPYLYFKSLKDWL